MSGAWGRTARARARHRRSTRRLATLSALGLVLGILGVGTTPADAIKPVRMKAGATVQAAAAAAPTGCGYGEGGLYANTICWLDMTSYDDTTARTAAGQDFSVALGGGYTLTFNIKTSVAAGFSNAAILPRTVPIETRFAFATEAYRSIPGKPSLYSQPAPGTKGLDVALSNIRLEDPSGNPLNSFSFVATDTEDNVNGESLRWTSDKNLDLLEVLYNQGTKGCKPANMTGLGTTTVSCTGTGGGSTLAEKSTSVLVSADAPSSFGLRWETFAQSGIAFGINTATIEVSKVVDGRADRSDSFDVSLTSPEGSVLDTATTGSARTVTTGPVVVIPPSSGAGFTLTDAITPGSGTDMSDYSRSWSCTRNGQNDPSLPSGSAATVQVAPGANENIACTVTNQSLTFDGGDAPNSYGTTLASGGPRHSIPDYDSTAQSSTLMIGSKVDTETDGTPSPASDADDGTGDDEDAFATLPLTRSTSPTLAVPVTNATGGAATLRGWIDADGNGVFSAAEAAAVSVPTGATTATLAWSGLPLLAQDAQVQVRLRLTTATITDNAATTGLDERSQGPAPDGEVEDYLGIVQRITVDCSTDSAVFNTAFNGSGGKLPAGSRDRLWEVGIGDATGPASVASYVPAFVIPPVAGAWDASPFGNADWISYNTNGSHAARIEVYFRYRFRIDPAVPLDGFALQMDFLADNSVPEVWVNGTAQSPTQDGLPQTTGNAYQYVGFKLVNRARTVLSDGFQHGANDIVVRVASDPGFVGFMAQMTQSPLCNDWGDAPNTYGTDAASGGPSHGVRDAASTELLLGDAVDIEPQGLPGTAADGDDTTDTDDEDAIADPITVQAGLPTTVPVSVTNDTAQAATLAGWIDLDDDGTFEVGERVTRSIPAGSGTAGYDLTFPATTVVGDSFARFRVFPGNVADPLPTGSTNAGEVEDYPTTFDPGDPIFFGCSDKVTFDTSNENWRAATTRGGTTVQLQPQPVEWQPDAGNPGGAVIEDDLDGQWTELWTPELNANGFTTDYSFAVGQTLAFDYRNNTGISVKLYMGIVGANGKFYWYDFSSQITDSKAWNRIRIPMDASKWHVSFNSSGPTGAAPTATAFADALRNIVRFSFSIEGQSGPDRTAFDNFGQLCSDFGDAPNSYGTEIGGESPSHAVDDTLPALRLGASLDVETAGQPSTGAILDDAIGTDDEDGVPDQIVMTTGDPTSVDVVVTNQTSERATLAGWLDLDGDGTFEVGERLTAQVPAGTNAATFTLDFPAGTTTTDTYARFRIFPGNVTAPLPKGSVSAGEIEDYAVAVENRALEVTKSSDATADTRPGDTVNYTIGVTNTGDAPFTVDNPAVVVDDLSAILDDGDYNDDASAAIGALAVADPTYAEPRLRWAGPLPGGATVTITYSVTLTGGGDGVVRNVAWAPDPGDPDPPTPDCDDVATTVPCAEEEFELPRLTLRKASDRTDLPNVGEHLTYTVVVKNEGPGDYSAAEPATFIDDLTDVLDDANFDIASITSSTGTATFTNPELSWSGVLVAGASATITYSVTYTEKAGGDKQLDNAACVPEDEAVDPAQACTTVRVPGSGLEQAKVSTPPTGTVVQVGDQITYTLRFANTGPASAIVSTSDDLSDVLDDAELVGNPSSPDGLTVTRAGDTFVVTGIVPTGQTYTVSYTVRVLPIADQGNNLLRNALACQPGDPLTCEPEITEHKVRAIRVTKTSDANPDPRQGDTVTYTVTAENVGAGDYTLADPATVVDDLTGVIDDGDYNEDATAEIGGTPVADPSYVEPRVTWTGALASGDTVTITYTVELDAGGDGVVRNVAWAPDPGDPVGPTPDCAGPATTVPCAEEEYELPRLTIAKTSDHADLPAVGEHLTYTVIVKNEGPGDYTAAEPATFIDDLTDVLDDSTFDAGSITADVGSASFADPNLSWTGVLAAGEDAEITYLVTYTAKAGGDQQLDNNACVPKDEALDALEACDVVRVPGADLTQTKVSSPTDGEPVDIGDEITYTLSFINDGQTSAIVNTSDDLFDVLDDAELVGSPSSPDGLTVTLAGDSLIITGIVPGGETYTVSYTVRVTGAGDGVLRNSLACQPGEPAGCVPETTEHSVRSIELTKTSNATADSRPGDVITYTVTARNRGTGDYTALQPAVVVDDLAGVIDDADFNDDASASIGGAAAADPEFLAPRLAWSGPLAAGEAVTITYTVTLKGGGDGHVDNVAWAPDPGDPHGPTPDCDDPATAVPCGDESYLLPKLSIAKSADPVAVSAVGDVVTYTVIVTNDGPGDYTAAKPATFADDLSAVLDDATFVAGSITATRGAASLATPNLSWTGVLTAGQSSTVTYQVRYTGAGDRSLVNAACVPEAEATDPAEDCAAVTVPGAGLSQTKTADPESGTTVGASDRITYTLTFINTGTGPARVDTSDDLSGVLDDAVLVAGPTAEAGLTATRNGDRILISGSVPPGQTRTVTYTVEVEAYADQADHVLRNALACQPGAPVTCEPERTEHPIGHVKVTKTSDAAPGIDTGDEVTYTVTVTNDGASPLDPAVVRDDLSDVLDDATYGSASADRGAVSFTAPTLTWTGRLEPGQVATITYTVTVTNQGDHDLGNIVVVPDCDEASCNPPPVITDLPYVVPDKTTDSPSGEGVQAGDVVTYTLSWTNNGKAAGDVDATDDFSDVLDDAELIDGPTSSSARVTVTRTGDTLRIVGPIDPGETVTVTYRVRIKPDGQRGDNVAGNVLTPDTPQVDCDGDECEPVDPPVTENPIGDLDDSKSVDPSSGDPVSVGDKLTYTLTFTNTGTGPVDVDREDDLSGVLDDATLVSGPTSSNLALQVSGPDGNGRIRVTGTLEPGQTVTVTYAVRVKKKSDRGDGNLTNFLVDPGEDPPPHCNVARALRAAEPGDCTENPASEVEATKDVDLPHSSLVTAGDVLTYTLKFVNRGDSAGEVDYIDSVADLLDDASWVSGPDSSDPALKARRDGNRLLITGTLEPGQVVTITYQVRVKADGQRGNGQLLNYLFPEGGVSPTACQSDRDDCTENAVSPNAAPPPPGTDPGDLPDTGSQFGPGLLVAGLLSVLLGVGLVVASRRRGPGEARP